MKNFFFRRALLSFRLWLRTRKRREQFHSMILCQRKKETPGESQNVQHLDTDFGRIHEICPILRKWWCPHTYTIDGCWRVFLSPWGTANRHNWGSVIDAITCLSRRGDPCSVHGTKGLITGLPAEPEKWLSSIQCWHELRTWTSLLELGSYWSLKLITHLAQCTTTSVRALTLGYLLSLAEDQVWIPASLFLTTLVCSHLSSQRCHQIRSEKLKPVAQVTYCFRLLSPKTLFHLHVGNSTT